ncbi:sterol desaturase family protein [Sphingomonas sp. MG17]|uniref:Sterol desaturase family protein n=1 Tax=Sphingomonas tagetis TaxID=2949092 RepID=A0A9X2KK40_9SPHN|nr:sterol desaturase family protein [Sphingomonas tagetis]MCP3729192.1 sterol desaturase family protein [Sphingomonas tagetis]
MDSLARLTETLPQLLAPWALGFASMTAIELLLPRERHSLRGRLPGLIFWSLWIPVMLLAHAAYRSLWAMIGIAPLNLAVLVPEMGPWANWTGAIVAPVLAAFIYDFFFYWFHRAQHRWLWRYHAVHHSIRELNAVNAYHHISEPLFQMLFLLVPASLIAVEASYSIPAVVVVLHLQASYIHSPARLDIGPLRALIVDNRFHRIHHSLDEHHFDKNFGACTTLWDRLFGTAWFPAKDEWPDVGLAGVEQPHSVRAWIDLPARLKRRGNPAPDGLPDAI